jgi:hypothetical protein
MGATTNNFVFAKIGWPEKARNVLYNLRMLSFEPSWNQNIACIIRPKTGSVQTSLTRRHMSYGQCRRKPEVSDAEVNIRRTAK